jgi:thioredoxin reductase
MDGMKNEAPRHHAAPRLAGGAASFDRFDVAVVGGGAAGLSAALVLSRARRHVLVVDSGSPRNQPASHMHGYLSRDGLAPATLLASGLTEVASYGGQAIADAVADVAACNAGSSVAPGAVFQLRLGSGRVVVARRLLIATGLTDQLPDIPGLQERWAKDVLHCPYCHGWEVRDQRLGVLADGSAESLRHAQLVRQWSSDVVVFVPPATITDEARSRLTARSVSVAEADITRVLVEDDRLACHAVRRALSSSTIAPCRYQQGGTVRGSRP